LIETKDALGHYNKLSLIYKSCSIQFCWVVFWSLPCFVWKKLVESTICFD